MERLACLLLDRYIQDSGEQLGALSPSPCLSVVDTPSGDGDRYPLTVGRARPKRLSAANSRFLVFIVVRVVVAAHKFSVFRLELVVCYGDCQDCGDRLLCLCSAAGPFACHSLFGVARATGPDLPALAWRGVT